MEMRLTCDRVMTLQVSTKRTKRKNYKAYSFKNIILFENDKMTFLYSKGLNSAFDKKWYWPYFPYVWRSFFYCLERFCVSL